MPYIHVQASTLWQTTSLLHRIVIRQSSYAGDFFCFFFGCVSSRNREQERESERERERERERESHGVALMTFTAPR